MKIINPPNYCSSWKKIIHKKLATSELHLSRTNSGPVQVNLLYNRRLLILFALILLPLLAGCNDHIRTESTGWNPPVSENGVVYVATKDGEMIALIDNGFEGVANREIWSFPASIDQTGIRGAYGTPVINDDLVYVAGIDGHVYALNKGNGSISDGGWKRPRGFVEEQAPLVSGLTYDPVNNIILSATAPGQLNAYTADLGEDFWENPFQADKTIWSTPVVDSQFAYFGSHDHNFYAVRLSDGKKFWNFQTGGVIAGKPLLFDDKVIFGSFDRTLYAVSADADGNVSVDWTFKGNNWFWAGAVTDGITIYAPNMDGNIYALDTNGNLLWKHNVGGSIVSQPVLVDRGLAVVNKGGDLVLLDTDTSRDGVSRELSNPIKLDAQAKAPLFSDGDVVFVGSQDRRVRRVDLKVGETAWCWDTRDGSCNN